MTNSEIEETKEKIGLILKDLEPIRYDNDPLEEFNGAREKYSSDPPSYIVRLILFIFADFVDYGSWDKTYWHTFLEYKGTEFAIEDNKFGNWSIVSRGSSGPNSLPQASDKEKN